MELIVIQYSKGFMEMIIMLSNKRTIFHIDVNSAYLSWDAVDRLQHGEALDLRTIPSAVGGDPKTRHGIILTKSTPAKKFGIKTGETLHAAYTKCPELVIVPPRYDVYVKASNALVELLKRYTPVIQRFSVDECFLDFTGMENLYKDPIDLAYKIKENIKEELGFTVSIGVSDNKLLAKMGSDLKKPDAVTSLFPCEIKEKMWPLPVEDLFMVGRATAPKLHRLNIFTIGDLANYNVDILKERLKSQGLLIWQYANGIEDSSVRKSNYLQMKGIGNSTTMPFDVDDRKTAHMVILSLSETVGMRLRNSENCCRLVSIGLRNYELMSCSRQRKLFSATDSTKKISEVACELFDELWTGVPLRHIGVSVSELCTNEFNQSSFFDEKDIDKNRQIDKTLDSLRMRFGSNAVYRSAFLHSGLKPMTGGIGEDEYPVMASML
jgi:DNA polymerase IV